MHNDEAETGGQPMGRRIHEAYSKLPEGERRIAETILESPSEIAVATATELASQAGVSNATVSRFFRRIGYANFDEARQEARRLRALGSPLFTGSRSAAAADPISDTIRTEAALIEATLTQLNPLTVREIGQAMAAAPRIRTMGYRNSHFLAEYLTAQLAQMRPGVAPLLLPGQTQSEGISTLGPGDLAIVVGLRRRPANFVKLIEAVAARGAKILLLADRTIRRAPVFATWTLNCVVDTPRFADSYVGAISVLRLLVLEAERALGDAGRLHLEQVEELRDNLGELE